MLRRALSRLGLGALCSSLLVRGVTMAHQFESGVFFGDSAWHGLGQTLAETDDRRWSVEGAIEAAGLDWTVSKIPLQMATCAEVPEELRGAGVPDTYAMVRDSDLSYLGSVGEQYTPLQNRELFNWFQPFLDARECSVETAGSLYNGRVVWVLARLQRDDIVLGDNDIVRKYLMLASSHSGKLATRVGFSPIRVVCANTLRVAIGHEQSALLRVRHTAGQKLALSAIRETVNLANQTFESTAEVYRRLMAAPISRADLTRYVIRVLRPEAPEAEYGELTSRARNQVDRVCQLAEGGRGQDGRLTCWSGYQGVTEWLSHERTKDAAKRLDSLWFGASATTNQRALELAIQLAA